MMETPLSWYGTPCLPIMTSPCLLRMSFTIWDAALSRTTMLMFATLFPPEFMLRFPSCFVRPPERAVRPFRSRTPHVNTGRTKPAGRPCETKKPRALSHRGGQKTRNPRVRNSRYSQDTLVFPVPLVSGRPSPREYRFVKNITKKERGVKGFFKCLAIPRFPPAGISGWNRRPLRNLFPTASISSLFSCAPTDIS